MIMFVCLIYIDRGRSFTNTKCRTFEGGSELFQRALDILMGARLAFHKPYKTESTGTKDAFGYLGKAAVDRKHGKSILVRYKCFNVCVQLRCPMSQEIGEHFYESFEV
jgi:hypothetical protein